MTLTNKFNLDDWPDDGTDWDGVHDDVMKKILEYKENAIFYKELCNGLQLAYDKLKEDAEINTKILVQAQNDAVIVEHLKKLLKPFPEGDFDIDAPEDCADVCRKLQKILGEKS